MCLRCYQVGWFLHTPFPSSEIYRALPRREEILRGVLKADLIGFHTYDYARHFMSACTRILGLEGTPEGVEDNGQVSKQVSCRIGRFIPLPEPLAPAGLPTNHDGYASCLV